MYADARLLLFAVALAFLCATAAGGDYTASCGSAPCPSVRWAHASAGQNTTFVLTSSKKTSAANSYVAFAFATGQKMKDTLVVIDCFDVNDTRQVRTSKNTPGGNEDSPSDLSKISNTNVRVEQGVFNCSFTMALPSQPVYAIIVEGAMDTSSAGPKKAYHGDKRWWSSSILVNDGKRSSADGLTYWLLVMSARAATQPFARDR